MPEKLFGLDFGTTNSLAATVIENEVRCFTDNGRPLPSVLWYHGEKVIVGKEARKQLDSADSSLKLGIVRSPKMLLRREGPIDVEGRTVEPVDAVHHVLRHVRDHVASQRPSHRISRAVMTIPVDFGGIQRRALRDAAGKAGIGVLQFVHEPAAALYAYFRAKPDYKRELARLEGRYALVFDWGGGTLDLTLCRILGGKLLQVASSGNNEIGGDQFDERLRNWVRDTFVAQNGIASMEGFEQPGARAALLGQCELAKIALSLVSEREIGVRDYLRAEGKKRDLVVNITRRDLEEVCDPLVRKGLAEIDALLDHAGLDTRDIELCLPTGGMVNMPAIRQGLTERFLSRAKTLPNGDRIIAEGAAWIAHDGLRLSLAKPLELLIADGSGRGTYLPIVTADQKLPVENRPMTIPTTHLYCTDPRDGVATLEFATPRKVGLIQRTDARQTIATLNLPVDPNAQPLIERIECDIHIDHDYIARIVARSNGRGAQVETECHELDFGLNLLSTGAPGHWPGPDGYEDGDGGRETLPQPAGITMRSNVANKQDWRLVPGDIVERWRPYFGDVRGDMTPQQRAEKVFYSPCSRCHRTLYQIRTFGPIDTCRDHGCPEWRPNA